MEDVHKGASIILLRLANVLLVLHKLSIGSMSSLSECHESAEVSFVDNNISPCDLEKSEEDGDNDDMLGGVFAFSEEGRILVV